MKLIKAEIMTKAKKERYFKSMCLVFQVENEIHYELAKVGINVGRNKYIMKKQDESSEASFHEVNLNEKDDVINLEDPKLRKNSELFKQTLL